MRSLRALVLELVANAKSGGSLQSAVYNLQCGCGRYFMCANRHLSLRIPDRRMGRWQMGAYGQQCGLSRGSLNLAYHRVMKRVTQE